MAFRTILQLSYQQLHDENNLQSCDLSRPEILGIYKHTITDEIADDLRLKYFKLPKPTSYPIDLNKGYEQFIWGANETPSPYFFLENVIHFILETEEKILQQNFENSLPSKIGSPSKFGISLQPPKRKLVLCHRGILTRIMLMPYRLGNPQGCWRKNDNKLCATRYGGILHIIDPVNFTIDKAIYHTYHRKFEQTCFSDDPDLEPDTDVPVDGKGTTFGIFRSTLEDFLLIYSSEITGVISEQKIDDIHNLDQLNACKFISTKLMEEKGNGHDDRFLQHPKCLLWWAQSYLANIQDICIGFRTRQGAVRNPVEIVRVEDIPNNQKWKPEVCLRFLTTMLKLIEDTMANVDCPYTVYEFEDDSYEKCIKSKIHNGKTDLSFLPENYIEHCKQQMKSK